MLLHNFGNTCYVNTTLQIFLNNPYFIDYLNSHNITEHELIYSIKNINDTSTYDYLEEIFEVDCHGLINYN